MGKYTELYADSRILDYVYSKLSLIWLHYKKRTGLSGHRYSISSYSAELRYLEQGGSYNLFGEGKWFLISISNRLQKNSIKHHNVKICSVVIRRSRYYVEGKKTPLLKNLVFLNVDARRGNPLAKAQWEESWSDYSVCQCLSLLPTCL